MYQVDIINQITSRPVKSLSERKIFYDSNFRHVAQQTEKSSILFLDLQFWSNYKSVIKNNNTSIMVYRGLYSPFFKIPQL